MSSKFKAITGTVATAALLSLCSPALAQSIFAQSDDADPEMRIERLENQLRQLTGQNEELQYRNRQLEERLRALEGGAQAAPGQAPSAAAMPPAQIAPSQVAPGYRQPQQQAVQPHYEQPQIASPAPIVQEQPAPGAPGTRRRGDAFDPNQNPNAPGAPRARAMPKSLSTGSRSSRRRTLAGLMSAWTMPAAWTRWRARARGLAQRATGTRAAASPERRTSRRDPRGAHSSARDFMRPMSPCLAAE